MPLHLRRGNMKIDPRYVDNGVVRIVNGCTRLTKLGQSYGFALLINLTVIKTNTPSSLEVYKSVEVCDIPKHILNETPHNLRFTEKGIKWVCEYVKNHPFNDYLYKEACKLNETNRQWK